MDASTPHFENVYSFDPKKSPRESQYSGHLNDTVADQYRHNARPYLLNWPGYFQDENTVFTNELYEVENLVTGERRTLIPTWSWATTPATVSIRAGGSVSGPQHHWQIPLRLLAVNPRFGWWFDWGKLQDGKPDSPGNGAGHRRVLRHRTGTGEMFCRRPSPAGAGGAQHGGTGNAGGGTPPRPPITVQVITADLAQPESPAEDFQCVAGRGTRRWMCW